MKVFFTVVNSLSLWRSIMNPRSLIRRHTPLPPHPLEASERPLVARAGSPSVRSLAWRASERAEMRSGDSHVLVENRIPSIVLEPEDGVRAGLEATRGRSACVSASSSGVRCFRSVAFAEHCVPVAGTVGKVGRGCRSMDDASSSIEVRMGPIQHTRRRRSWQCYSTLDAMLAEGADS